MEKATSPQALPRPQCHLLFKGLPTQLCEDIPKGRERPGLLPFLSLANQSTCAFPPHHHQLPRRADRVLRNCSLPSGRLQMCTAGPILPHTLEFHLPEEGIGQAGKLRLTPVATERDQGGDWRGRCQRGSPSPHRSPPQAGSAALDEFVYKTQDFLLLEKRAFYRA